MPRPNVNAADASGNTALHRAARRGHTAIVAALLKAGADATARNKNGETPLSYSVRMPKLTKSRAGCISLLQHYGAKVDDMARALMRWDEDVLTLLVAMSPQPALPPGLDISAPQIDALLDMGMHAGLLVHYVPNIYRRGGGHTIKERRKLLSRLLAGGINPAAKVTDGNTLVHFPASVPAPSEDLRLVLSTGGDRAVNEQNDAGETPLHLFVDSQSRLYMRVSQTPASGRADEFVRDGRGRTALQCLDARIEKRGADKALAPMVEQLEICSYQ